MPDDAIQCPACGSTQIHAEKRGWSIGTGLLGSASIIITCLACGHRFAPGQGLIARATDGVQVDGDTFLPAPDSDKEAVCFVCMQRGPMRDMYRSEEGDSYCHKHCLVRYVESWRQDA